MVYLSDFHDVDNMEFGSGSRPTERPDPQQSHVAATGLIHKLVRRQKEFFVVLDAFQAALWTNSATLPSNTLTELGYESTIDFIAYIFNL